VEAVSARLSGGEDRVYYHGTVEPGLKRIQPGRVHGKQIFPHVTDPDFAYANPGLAAAYHYAELAYNAADYGRPRVYKVRATGPVEDDPEFNEHGHRRSIMEGDIRSRHHFEVIEEMPAPDWWVEDDEENYDWDEDEDVEPSHGGSDSGRGLPAVQVRNDTDPSELDSGPPATDVREQYIRRVASDYRTMPEGSTTILTAHDRDGQIVGAMSVIDYPDRDHPHMVIGHVGSLEGSGAGSMLVRAAVSLALSRDRDILYTEPTANAALFWAKMGFEHDPADVGTYYYGIAGRGALFDWLEAHP
jgi:hypothetical protein